MERPRGYWDMSQYLGPRDSAQERGNCEAFLTLVTVTAGDSCSGFDVRSTVLQGGEDVTFVFHNTLINNRAGLMRVPCAQQWGNFIWPVVNKIGTCTGVTRGGRE